jgi:hypothetical protein
MAHPCACCALRFATNPELAAHVQDEHSEHPPFAEGRTTVQRRRWTAPVPPPRVSPGRHALR